MKRIEEIDERMKVITKLDRNSFHNIIGTMDVGSVFNPRHSVSNLICGYVRAMQNSVGSKVETLYKLVDGRVEALEFQVAENADFCGVPFQKLQLRKNLLIGSILRNGKVIIPSGQDSLQPGDNVIVVTTITGLSDLRDILEKRKG